MRSRPKYQEDPACRGYWFYDGLRIQANVDTHRFAVEYADHHYPARCEILDIATGEGALAKQLIDRGFRVSCTAWNDKCRIEIPTYRVNLDQSFLVDDVGGHRYSLICCIDIIEHVENPANFLRCCREIMGPDSRMLLSTPNVESAASRLQWLVHGCPKIFDEGEVRNNRHISMQWRQGLEVLIEQSGLAIVEKHLLGSFRLPQTALGLVKRGIYRVMENILPGENKGSTRVYVLAKCERGPLRNPADRVY